MGVPTTFRYLDLTWKPMLKVSLQKSEPGGDHAPTKFSIQEKQGKRDVCEYFTPHASLYYSFCHRNCGKTFSILRYIFEEWSCWPNIEDIRTRDLKLRTTTSIGRFFSTLRIWISEIHYEIKWSTLRTDCAERKVGDVRYGARRCRRSSPDSFGFWAWETPRRYGASVSSNCRILIIWKHQW